MTSTFTMTAHRGNAATFTRMNADYWRDRAEHYMADDHWEVVSA